MIFKRRNRRNWTQALRDALAPRKGWRRGLTYIGRRVQRLPDTPHRIALGFACGVVASFTPFFMFHAFVAALIAWLARGNILAGVLGTIVNNPLTIAPIAATSLSIGNWLLGVEDGIQNLEGVSLDLLRQQPSEAADIFWSLFTPYLVGGVGPGIVAAFATYTLLKPLVARFQQRRRSALAQRARALLAARRAAQAGRSRAPRAVGGPPSEVDGASGDEAADPVGRGVMRGPARPGGAAFRVAGLRLGSPVMDRRGCALR